MSSSSGPDALFLDPDYHELIGLVYDAVNSSHGFFPFLQRFVEVFQSHSASFSIYNTETNAMLGFWTVNMPQHALEFYAKHMSHQDILLETALQAHASGERGFVASNLDLGPNAAERRRQTRADEWLQSYGAKEAAGAITLLDDSYVNFFAVQRSERQPDFSHGELAIFDYFLPHLSRAVRLYTQLSARGIASAEKQALNQIPQGILVCDSTYRMIFKNTTADSIIADNPDLQLSEDGLLHFRDKGFAREFAVQLSFAMERSVSHHTGGESVLCYQHNGQNLTVVISPLTPASGTTDGKHRGGAMISLYDWSLRPSVRPETLQKFFSLTTSEARVAAQLVEGKSIADIAEHSHRTRETVRSHLKSIFRKTNTSRQGELIALLASATV